jgi:hypothetical protein
MVLALNLVQQGVWKMNENPFEPKKQSFVHKLGDKIERLGERISRAGAIKTGKLVYNSGNKIEHMNDKKPNKV